jgi:hypothetical protein
MPSKPSSTNPRIGYEFDVRVAKGERRLEVQDDAPGRI